MWQVWVCIKQKISLLKFQKQPPEVFCKKRFSEKLSKFHSNTSALGSLFNKVVSLTIYRLYRLYVYDLDKLDGLNKTSSSLYFKSISKEILLTFSQYFIVRFSRCFFIPLISSKENTIKSLNQWLNKVRNNL